MIRGDPVSAASARLHALLLVMLSAVLWSTAASAQQPAIHRIGVMTAGALSSVEEGLREGLRELGYVDGKNLIIEWRRSLGTETELRSLASELAGAKVEVIVTVSTSAARVLLQTTTVPIVFIAGDPVGTGLAVSTARPGGRATGVSMLNRELIGKRMELLRQVAPGMRRIFFLTNPSNPLDVRMLEEA